MAKSTICFSAINPRPIKKHKAVSSIVSQVEFLDDVEIVDASQKIVNITKKPTLTNDIDTNKMAQSFARTAGIKALAKRVAFSDLGTIYDDSGNILDATQLPENIIQAQDVLNAGKTARANFSAMPKEITKNMDPEEFVKTYKQEDLINAINNLYASANTQNKQEQKEDNQ